MKLTLPEMIQIWNGLDEIVFLNDAVSPRFSAYVKRYQVKARPEINFWDSLTESERVSFMQTKIDLQLEPYPSKFLPAELPIDRIKFLQKVVDGEINYDTTPALKKLIEQQKTQKTEEVAHDK